MKPGFINLNVDDTEECGISLGCGNFYIPGQPCMLKGSMISFPNIITFEYHAESYTVFIKFEPNLKKDTDLEATFFEKFKKMKNLTCEFCLIMKSCNSK